MKTMFAEKMSKEEKKEFLNGLFSNSTNCTTYLCNSMRCDDEEKKHFFVCMIGNLISDFEKRCLKVGLPYTFNEILKDIKLASIESLIKPENDILTNEIYIQFIESIHKSFDQMV